MEVLLKQLFSGNTILVGGAIVILFYLHKEAMGKIDKLTESIVAIAQTSALHAKELEIGSKKFEALEKDVHKLRESNHEIRNNMLTDKHLEMILEKLK